MKKIISVVLCVITVMCCFASCGKSDATKAVEAKINAIGKITLEKGDAISDAEAAFELLSTDEGSDVKNFDILVEARNEYDKLIAYKEKADALIEMYDKVFIEYGITYQAIADELNSLNQNIVPSTHESRDEYDKIFAEVNKKHEIYTEIASLSLASAEVYVNGFLAYKKSDSISVKEIGCLAQESDGIMYFLFALTYDEGDGVEKKVYSTARFAETPSIETMLRYAQSFYSESPLSENTDALKNGNILIELNIA